MFIKINKLIIIIKKLKSEFPFLITDDPLVTTILNSTIIKTDKKEYIQGCIIPNGGIAIYPDINIKLCSRISNFDTTFNLKNFDLVKYIKKFNYINKIKIKKCSNCKFFSICQVGCLATSYIKNKKYSKDIQCIRNY